MGEAEGSHGLVLVSELGEGVDASNQLLADDLHRLLDLDEVGVVADVAGGGTEMDDGHGLGDLLAPGVDVSHDIVAQELLLLGSALVVDVVDVGLHLLDLLVGDIETKLLLGSSESDPELSPCRELLGRRPDVRHLLGGITRDA